MGSPVPDFTISESAPAAPRERAHRCVHCGLELGARHREEDGPFCCSGCRTVYELIHDEGLERYYDLRHGETAPAAELHPGTFAWLDVMLEQAADAGDGLLRLGLDLQGVHCAACVWLLEQLFHRRPGGRDLRINPALGTVELVWDPRLGDLREYLAEAERFGYRFGPPRRTAERRSRGLLVRLAVTVAAALNVMIFSFSYYFGLAPHEFGPAYVLFGRLSLALCTLAVAVGGWPFFAAAVRGLRRGVVHLDLPIALGMLLGWGGSVAAYLAHGPEAAYFDTVTIFTALMLVGRWLQEWVLERNRNSLLASGGIADLYARRVEAGDLRAVPAAELRTGDELWIAPGDLAPVTGVLLQRPAVISLDWITGESDAQDRSPGEKVPAGAFNAGETGFRLGAVEDFSDSRLHELLRSGRVRDDSDAPRDAWHRVATVYVLAVLLLAAIGFVVWTPAGMRRAAEVAVSLLVVTCPCALGLAVPLARELIHVRLRRRGVLLRNNEFLEKALRVRKLLFDKTGTLTRGRLALTDDSRRELLALPASERRVLWNLTARSLHPVSRCVAAALALTDAAHLDPVADTVREEAGRGLTWDHDGSVWRFGRPAAASEDEQAVPSGAAVFSRDGRPLAAPVCVEELKPDAADEVARLRDAGFEIHVLSGDTPARVAAAAASLGLAPENARGGLDPARKAGIVGDLDRHDTLMVGDGLNDSPSFDAAWTAATPAVDRAVLPQKADFYYLGDGIAAVRRALAAARRLRSVQAGNLAFAAVYNLGAAALCLAGLVKPVVAAVLMPASSVTVVLMTTIRLSGRRAA